MAYKPINCAIVLIGGVGPGNEYVTQVEDVEDNSDCRGDVPDLPEGRSYAGAAMSAGLPVFCGGFGVGGRHSECWTLYEDGWRESEPLVEKRNLFTMTAVNDKIVVTGGSNDVVGDLASVEIYEDGLWTINPGMELTSTRFGHCAVEYMNKLIIIGGVSSRHTMNVVEMMDMTKIENGWTTLPAMIIKRGYTACAVVEVDGITGVLVTGGWNGLDYIDAVEFLNLEFFEWEQLPSLLTGRADHSLAVVGGLATVFGGFDDGALNTSEVFTTDGWRPGKDIAQNRYGQSVMDIGCY